VRVRGITNQARFNERVPTVSITHAKLSPLELADYLASRGIFAWHGNFYALLLTEALGLEPEGMVRLGLLHYNTSEEVGRLLSVLKELE
jgi:selenocysteine lyase/cysteine desulfurase